MIDSSTPLVTVQRSAGARRRWVRAAGVCRGAFWALVGAMMAASLLAVESRALCWSFQASEAPQLTRLFPPGAARGGTTEIEIKGKYHADSVRLWSHVPGLSWQKREGEEKFAVTIDAEVEPGVVWVRLVDHGGASDLLPFVVSDWSESNEVEPNDRSDAAQEVTELPRVINGVLQRGGDVDHYRVAVLRGQTLVAVVDAQRHLQSAVDATMQLVTVEGQILLQSMDYRGLDPQIVWTAPEDREVVLRVFGFPAAPDSTISLGGGERFLYRLSLTSGAAVEAVAPLALERGVTNVVQLHGWNLMEGEQRSVAWGDGTERERTFRWPRVLGQLTLPVVDHPSRLAMDVRVAGQRGLDLGVASVVGSGPGLDAGQLDFGAESADSAEESVGALAVPVTITGNVTRPQQVDRFLLEVPEGKSWRVEVTARELGYAWDPVVEIYSSSDGKRLHRQDDQGNDVDPAWDWSPPAAGRYWLQLFDLHGHAGGQQWYRLSVTELKPLVNLRAERDRYQGRVGEPLEIKVTVERKHGYALDLEIGLETATAPGAGLSIRCDAQQSTAANESGKQVTLRLESTEAFQGPIRLVARELAEGAGTHAIVGGAAELRDIWVSFVSN